MKLVRHILNVLLTTSLTSSVVAQSPPYSVLTVNDGLPSNTVYGILQDREGYMWFGTDAGLARYDGSTMRIWTSSDGLSDNEVLSMYEDPIGRIWCLMLNGRLSYIANEKAYGLKDHPEFAQIRPASGFLGMAVDDEGYYWFGGIGGELYSWRAGKVRTHSVADHRFTPPQKAMVLPLRLGNGRVRVVVNGSLYACRAGEPGLLRSWGAQLNGIPMVSVSGDSLVANGANGPLVLHDDVDTAIPVTHAHPPAAFRPPHLFKDGTIWHATGGYGIVKRYPVDRERPTTLILEHLMVHMLFEDSEENIWCSTDGEGVVLISKADRELSLIQASREQRHRTVTSVLMTKAGDVIFGTAGGAILRLRGDLMDTLLLPPVPQPARERVRDLQEAADGAIWFTTDMRSGRFGSGRGSKVEFVKVLDDRMTQGEVLLDWGQKSLATGADGTVAASAFGLAVLEDGEYGLVFAYRKRYHAGIQRIYAPHVMPDGTIWFETMDLLHRLKKEEGTSVQVPIPGSHVRITDIDALEDGTLVIATAGNGTFLLRNGDILARFTTGNGATSDQCKAAVVRDGRILVATDAGAYIIEDPLGEQRIQVFRPTGVSPLRDVEDIDGDDEHLYLATPDGLCIVPLPLKGPAVVRPLLHVQQVLVNDTTKALKDSVEMLLGDRLTIALTALAYTAPEQIRIEWSTSLDGPWQPTERVTQFNGLTAGRHDFHFRASLPHGPWSSIRTVAVSVLPPWYRTSLALFAAVVLCATFLFLLTRAYFRSNVRRHKDALLKQLATQEERHRIASELHDDLGADISHLLLLTRQTTSSATIPPRQLEQLASLDKHAHSLMHKIDEIIWSLDPADDELRSTLAFIQRYAEQFAASHDLVFRTQPIPNGPPVPCSSKERRDLYLVVKELLQNVIKHNVVHTLRVVLSFHDHEMIIILEDDGTLRPMNGPNGRNGHGKANIMERLDRLSGTLRTEPLGPTGTRTTITVPIPTQVA
ncbi:MAG TPA: two-component regulator propeller domain-containing protein [Flavobacteriales bacterium]|jgi:signal transduction histidine kinase/outer membrane protein assembly factor BamB|nr:two-component regulator propeller domain-containing protein [Flavobacteriales bacterium]